MRTETERDAANAELLAAAQDVIDNLEANGGECEYIVAERLTDAIAKAKP